MSQRIDREGTFLAKPVDWSMHRTESSQSVALVVRYAVLGQFFGEEVQDWSSAEVETVAYHYWVKKDGTLNQATLDMLRKAGVWNGSLLDVKNSFPPAIEVRLNVQNQPYNDKDRYKVAWVNHRDDDSEPGGIKKMDDKGFRDLEGRFGSMLRALGGAAQKSTPPPAAKPSAPKPAPVPAGNHDPLIPPNDGVQPVGDDKPSEDLPF